MGDSSVPRIPCSGRHSLEAAEGSLVGGPWSQMDGTRRGQATHSRLDNGEGGALARAIKGTRTPARGPGHGTGSGLAGSGGAVLGKRSRGPV